MEYTREEILEGKFWWPKHLMEVVYSNHALGRIKERERGSLLLYPKHVRITEDNLYKGYSRDGKFLNKVVVRLIFKTNEWIYLVILTNQKLIKSVWFEKIRK